MYLNVKLSILETERSSFLLHVRDTYIFSKRKKYISVFFFITACTGLFEILLLPPCSFGGSGFSVESGVLGVPVKVSN